MSHPIHPLTPVVYDLIYRNPGITTYDLLKELNCESEALSKRLTYLVREKFVDNKELPRAPGSNQYTGYARSTCAHVVTGPYAKFSTAYRHKYGREPSIMGKPRKTSPAPAQPVKVETGTILYTPDPTPSPAPRSDRWIPVALAAAVGANIAVLAAIASKHL